jgi:hypothetical protein
MITDPSLDPEALEGLVITAILECLHLIPHQVVTDPPHAPPAALTCGSPTHPIRWARDRPDRPAMGG